MGIQVEFSKQAAIKAGAVFTLSFDKETNHFFETFRLPKVENRCFTNYYSNEEKYEKINQDKVCTDFNSWGSNKGLLEPWLLENDIEYSGEWEC